VGFLAGTAADVAAYPLGTTLSDVTGLPREEFEVCRDAGF
jgi:hypothetical protein